MKIDVPIGTTVATDYRIERELARGGMGVVYVATQLSTGRQRALKLMHPTLVQNERMRRRFEQEARVGSRIDSEHVVQVIAAGVEPKSGMPWIAMELLEGEDLQRLVDRRGPLGLEETAQLFAQVCHGLAAAHRAGVVHRDLKPENVFLMHARREGAALTVKLLDLGIAKIVAESRPADTAAIGTPLWMAPEQAGGAITPAADVWSLGLLVFWMLTGKCYWLSANGPADRQSVISVLREVAVEPLEPASVRARKLGARPELMAGFDAWFARCVARDPAERFPNAGVAREAFESARLGIAATAPLADLVGKSETSSDQSSFAASRTTTIRLPRRGAWLGVAAAAVAATAIFVLLPGRSKTESELRTAAPAISASAAEPAGSSAPHVVRQRPPPALAPGERAVDQSDSTTIWKIPVGDSPIRGPVDAPVTIVEFGNFQCPFSRAMERELQKLLDENPTSVRLVWKDDPLAVHSQADAAAQLAREARHKLGDEGFWRAHDLLLDKRLLLSTSALIGVGKKLGLEPGELATVIAKRRHAEAIERDADLADDFAAIGTPYFFVNGRRIAAAASLDLLRAAVRQELSKVAELERSGVPRAKIYDHLTANGRGGLPYETRKLERYSTLLPGRGASERMDAAMIQFCDYTHFMCRLVDPLVDELLERFEGRLGVTWVDTPRDDLARMAALAGRVAWNEKGEPGFDQMRRLLLGGQKQGLSKRSIASFAEKVGLERARFLEMIDEPTLNGDIDRMLTESKKQEIEVPGFLICGGNYYCLKGGYYLTGGHPRRAFEKRIRLIMDSGGVMPGSEPSVTPPG
jgi:serine/threonine protein kinase/predicted DsbA family dithiol-disulfide isomerase